MDSRTQQAIGTIINHEYQCGGDEETLRAVCRGISIVIDQDGVSSAAFRDAVEMCGLFFAEVTAEAGDHMNATEQAVIDFMARDSVGVEFTTQQLADRALGDPYRAGELRDVVLPALIAAGKVAVLEADDDHNSRRYVLADSPTDFDRETFVRDSLRTTDDDYAEAILDAENAAAEYASSDEAQERLAADSVAATSVYSLGCRVCITADRVTINAGPSALYEWAHKPSSVWPCSVLASDDCGGLFVKFDAGGLCDFDVAGWTYPEDVPVDELNAFCADVLRETLPVDHPAYFVTVGQFERN